MRSPLTISYPSLIRLAEEVLKEAERRHVSARERGTRNMGPLTARVENAKVLVKMLKRCEPGKQCDLFAKFKEVVK